MKALLTNYPQSPRKVRLVADLIRGKSVRDARAALAFMPKKSSSQLVKLLDSAVANARGRGETAENLFVKVITVDKGAVLRRYRPYARGRAGTLRKTRATVRLELGTKQVSAARGQVSEKSMQKKSKASIPRT